MFYYFLLKGDETVDQMVSRPSLDQKSVASVYKEGMIW
jgi:hypothetical protein